MTQQHDEPLFEALNYKDLEGQMQPVIGIDNYASKMGTDDQIIVLDFEVKRVNLEIEDDAERIHNNNIEAN